MKKTLASILAAAGIATSAKAEKSESLEDALKNNKKSEDMDDFDALTDAYLGIWGWSSRKYYPTNHHLSK